MTQITILGQPVVGTVYSLTTLASNMAMTAGSGLLSTIGGQPVGSYNVMDSGAHGNGTDDDRQHILDAITAAGSAAVYFPAGTYLLSSTLTVPAGTDLVGPSSVGPDSTAHLKGAVVYGSDQTFTDLKIGDLNKTGIVNGSGAANTTFTRCQFRGGGGNMQSPVLFGGGDNSCDHITFTDCNVERSLYTGADPEGNNANNVIWVEVVNSLSGAHMEYITFTRCHFGVSNGLAIARNIGSPRMNVELYQLPGAGAVRTGWHHVYFYDCLFEGAGTATFNTPSAVYSGAHTDGYLTVDGCTFYGGTTGCVNIEGPNYVTVSDCDIYPASQFTVSFIQSAGVDSHDWHFTNNRVHLDDFSSGWPTSRNTEPAIWLQGTDSSFTDNIIHASTYGGYWLIWLGWYYETVPGTNNVTITGNHIHELRTSSQRMIEIYSATNCTITGNTFETAASSFPSGTPATYEGTNTGTTVISDGNNTLTHA